MYKNNINIEKGSLLCLSQLFRRQSMRKILILGLVLILFTSLYPITRLSNSEIRQYNKAFPLYGITDFGDRLDGIFDAVDTLSDSLGAFVDTSNFDNTIEGIDFDSLRATNAYLDTINVPFIDNQTADTITYSAVLFGPATSIDDSSISFGTTADAFIEGQTFDSLRATIYHGDSLGTSGNCFSKAYIDTIVGCSPVVFSDGFSILNAQNTSLRDTFWSVFDTNYSGTDTATADHSDTICMELGPSYVLWYYDIGPNAVVQTNSGYSVDTIAINTGSVNCIANNRFTYQSDPLPLGESKFKFCTGDTTDLVITGSDTLFFYWKQDSCPLSVVDSFVGYWDSTANQINVVCAATDSTWQLSSDDTCIAIRHHYEVLFEISTGVYWKPVDQDTSYDGKD